MCRAGCELCGGWDSRCKGTFATIQDLEDKVKIRDEKIKFLKKELLLREAETINLRGKSPTRWEVK